MSQPNQLPDAPAPTVDAAVLREGGTHAPVQYDAGCEGHGGTTERHCAEDGHPMPAPTVDAAEVPFSVPPSDPMTPAWEALRYDLRFRVENEETLGAVIRRHRPLIEATLRASALG